MKKLVTVATVAAVLVCVGVWWQNRTFAVTGQVLTDNGGGAGAEPVKGVAVLFYKVRLDSVAAFRGDSERVAANEPSADTYDGCQRLMAALQEHYTDTKKLDDKELNVLPSRIGLEKTIAYDAQTSPFLETATDLQGRFAARLPRGNYVILVTHTWVDESGLSGDHALGFEFFSGFLPLANDTSTVLSPSDCSAFMRPTKSSR